LVIFQEMKLSIIINFYQSNGVMQRQVKHFAKMNLSDEVEFIFVDDGTAPTFKPETELKNLRVIQTGDKRAWTQGLARNRGAKEAKGMYLLMTDADHILSKEAIDRCLNFVGDKMIFPRYLAILDEDGNLKQDEETLTDYGADTSRFGSKRGLYASYHGNTFCIKRYTFELLGGYPEKACVNGFHAESRKGEDSYLNTKWNHYARDNKINLVVGPKIYIFPIGRYNVNYDLNPKGLFHNLSYEAKPQPNKK